MSDERIDKEKKIELYRKVAENRGMSEEQTEKWLIEKGLIEPEIKQKQETEPQPKQPTIRKVYVMQPDGSHIIREEEVIPMERVGVRLPRDMIKKLEASYSTKSKTIRQALKEYFERKENETNNNLS